MGESKSTKSKATRTDISDSPTSEHSPPLAQPSTIESRTSSKAPCKPRTHPKDRRSFTWSRQISLKTSQKTSSTNVSKTRRPTKTSLCSRWKRPKQRKWWRKKGEWDRMSMMIARSTLLSIRWTRHSVRKRTLTTEIKTTTTDLSPNSLKGEAF